MPLVLLVPRLCAAPVLLLLLAGPGAAAGPRSIPDRSAPLDPVSVTRPFAPGPTPYSPGHRGADLAGTVGQPVRAAGAGPVTYAGLVAGRGVVVVGHGDLRTTYEPVTAQVRVGQQVTAGQALGTLDGGHAGCPAPACLHWGLRRGETYLDPVRLLRAGPVRLLTPGGAAGAAGVLEPRTSARLGSRSRGPDRPEPSVAGPAPGDAGPARTILLTAALGGGVLVLGQSRRRVRG